MKPAYIVIIFAAAGLAASACFGQCGPDGCPTGYHASHYVAAPQQPTGSYGSTGSHGTSGAYTAPAESYVLVEQGSTGSSGNYQKVLVAGSSSHGSHDRGTRAKPVRKLVKATAKVATAPLRLFGRMRANRQAARESRRFGCPNCR